MPPTWLITCSPIHIAALPLLPVVKIQRSRAVCNCLQFSPGAEQTCFSLVHVEVLCGNQYQRAVGLKVFVFTDGEVEIEET